MVGLQSKGKSMTSRARCRAILFCFTITLRRKLAGSRSETNSSRNQKSNCNAGRITNREKSHRARVRRNRIEAMSKIGRSSEPHLIQASSLACIAICKKSCIWREKRTRPVIAGPLVGLELRSAIGGRKLKHAPTAYSLRLKYGASISEKYDTQSALFDHPLRMASMRSLMGPFLVR